MKTAYESYRAELAAIREAGTYKDERIITTPQKSRIDTTAARGVVNMCANNYLGLSNHPRLIEAAKKSYDDWGFGLSSVRFICGTQEIHKTLERKIADFVGMEDAILYSSCFDANGGLFETLLGADDKAGVAEIMTALERIVAENRPHGKLCIGFTPDEEIGEGASLFDVEGFGAAYAYTVDGEDVGEISYENFNAAAAVVTVHGFSVHPGSAKNAMINAQNVAMEFHAALPAFSRPEHTEGREGFFHLTSMQGDVTTAHLGYIVRDHDAAKFAARKAQMQHIAACLNDCYGAGTVELDIKDSYYNMLEKIQPHFHLVENARKAIRAAGLAPIETPVRGGTDGATLSYMGLPCPNLGTGGFNFHGPCECITAEKMDQGVEILLNLVELYK